MEMKGLSAFLLSLGLLVAAGMLFTTHRSPAAPAPSKTAVRWEYKLVTEEDIAGKEGDSHTILAKVLNKLGEEGWELAASGPGCHYMKRLIK
jgi:hypothetical protein